MATDGHIKSVHQVADGEIHAPLGYGTFFSYSVILYVPSIVSIFIIIPFSRLPK